MDKHYNTGVKKMINNLLQTEQINTDADASLKGLGLQKIRAVERLLKALIEGKKAVICTIECIDDVLEVDISGKKAEYVTEQDKFYESSFSMNSKQVKNSLRIFFDNWYGIVEASESIKFVFYTTTSISKENKVGVLKKMKEELPEEPLLKLLIERKYDKAFPFVLPILKEYYIEQHEKHTKDITVYEKIWDSVTDEKWEIFFDLIEWNFGEKDEIEVRNGVYQKVQQLCGMYGVEEKFTDIIVGQLIYMVESRTFEKDFLRRVVHVGEVMSLFLQFAQDAKVREKLDPMHLRWDTIHCDDIRDINDKILSVCPQYNKDELELLEGEYIDGSFEQKQYFDIRQVKAYNYRIYMTCKRIVIKSIKDNKDGFTQSQIDEIIKQLTDEAEEIIKDKAKTYKMPFDDRDMIRKTIIILFQECYLAFDERSIING
jgi:hypothetical protein